MIFGVEGAAISQVQLDRAKDTGTMGGFRAVIASGSAPNQWVVVHQSTLEQYQQMVSSLEANLKTHQDYIAQMMARHGYGLVTEGTDEPTQGLDAASTAVVNSLLRSVPESNFYRDDDQK
jgi:hypothetical protein